MIGRVICAAVVVLFYFAFDLIYPPRGLLLRDWDPRDRPHRRLDPAAVAVATHSPREARRTADDGAVGMVVVAPA